MKEIKNIVEQNYELDDILSISKRKELYYIETKEKSYILKRTLNKNLSKLINVMISHDVNHILYPKTNKKGTYTTKVGGYIYFLLPYVKSVEYFQKNKVYNLVNSLLEIHLKTSMTKKIDQTFMEKNLKHIDKIVTQRINILESFAREFESNNFRTPFAWQYLMNYHKIYNLLKIYNESKNKLVKSLNEQKNILISIIHGKPFVEHLLNISGQNLLISYDEMKVSLPIIDIVMLFVNYADLDINIDELIEQSFLVYKDESLKLMFFVFVCYVLITNLPINTFSSANDSVVAINQYTSFLKKISTLITVYNKFYPKDISDGVT